MENVNTTKSAADIINSVEQHKAVDELIKKHGIMGKKTWTGRVAGVGAAAIASALEAHNKEGITAGVVTGGLIGGVAGYYVGNGVDIAQGFTGQSSVVALMIPALIGFTGAVIGQAICDRYVDNDKEESMSILEFTPAEVVNQFGL